MDNDVSSLMRIIKFTGLIFLRVYSKNQNNVTLQPKHYIIKITKRCQKNEINGRKEIKLQLHVQTRS